MQKLFSMDFRTNTVSSVLLIVRIVIAVMMLVHGLPKLQMLFSGNVQFPEVMGMGATFSLALAVFAEVVCSVFLLFGLFTRLAAVPLIVTMLVAVIVVHGGDPFTQKELGLHYLTAYLSLFILGGGKYSLDAMLLRKFKRRTNVVIEQKTMA